MKKLFEFCFCGEDGYYGAINLFAANCREDAAEYILEEIRKYLENIQEKNTRGGKYFCILQTILEEIINSQKGYERIRTNGFRLEDYELKIFQKWIKRITPEQLLEKIDHSYVDRSNTQISLHEYSFEDIIQL